MSLAYDPFLYQTYTKPTPGLSHVQNVIADASSEPARASSIEFFECQSSQIWRDSSFGLIPFRYRQKQLGKFEISTESCLCTRF